jgi:hypothetical protein
MDFIFGEAVNVAVGIDKHLVDTIINYPAGPDRKEFYSIPAFYLHRRLAMKSYRFADGMNRGYPAIGKSSQRKFFLSSRLPVRRIQAFLKYLPR